MSANPFYGAIGNKLWSYTTATPITPNDVNVQAVGTSYRGLYIGVAGNISVILQGDSAPVTFALPVGFAPLWVKQVRATGTTASNIVGLN